MRNIIEIIRKNKLAMVFLSLTAVLFVASFYIVFFGRGENPITNIFGPSPTPDPYQTGFVPEYEDRPLQVVDESTIENFEVVSVYPGVGKVGVLTRREAIGFRFSFPINPDTVNFSIEPEIENMTSYDEEYYIYYISPREPWVINQIYTIQIDADSLSGRSLSEPFKTTFIPVDSNESFLNEHEGE